MSCKSHLAKWVLDRDSFLILVIVEPLLGRFSVREGYKAWDIIWL